MFHLDPTSSLPIYEQIVRKVKELHIKKVLNPGDKLPSVRELSAMIIANPNTVSKAYQELERQGVIETVRGKGTFMAENPQNLPDRKQREYVRQKLQTAVLDAVFAGIGEQEIHDWVQEQLTKTGGGEHA